MRLALFDFDGTITTKDSFLLFMRYAAGPVRFWLNCFLLSPKILLYLGKKYPNHKLKKDFLRRFFHNWPVDKLENLAHAYCRDIIPTIIRPKAKQKLEEHNQTGDLVIVVSACPEFILAPWCTQNGLKLIATRLAVKEQKVTGGLEGENCWGDEKVRRIEQELDLKDYATIFAYGDSRGDHAMLKIAHHSHYKPFQ